MNLAGIAFLFLTWQQLFGSSASDWQTALTLVGAALSVGVVIALYVRRKTQIEELQEKGADAGAIVPGVTTEEGTEETSPPEDKQAEVSEQDEPIPEPSETDLKPGDEGAEVESSEQDSINSNSLTPEELEKERK
ncbi:MAG: hypothetical protein ACOC38_06120, partial [Promethearchaeia archaeon]